MYVIGIVAILAGIVLTSIGIDNRGLLSTVTTIPTAEVPHEVPVFPEVYVDDEYRTYLPMIIKSDALIGVEWESYQAKWYNTGTELKISIVVPYIIDKPLDIPDFSSVYKKLGDYHADVIIVKMWLGDPMCKLPPEEYWDYYAALVQKIIYEFKPERIGIYNEPNTAAHEMPEDHYSFYGCIGDGKAYGRFVKHIYGRVHGAEIMIGEVSNIYDEPFVSDMLSTVGNSYDALSFHCYESFYYGLADTCTEKYKYAQSLTNKPVYLDETAVMYHGGDLRHFEYSQKEHMTRLLELDTAATWYTGGWNGWPKDVNADLVYKDGNKKIVPRPVWTDIYNRLSRVP